jgi:XTP/dITP diphosphohydrolase
MTTLIIATRNAHKLQEIRAILSDKFRFLTLNDFPGAPKTVEDANSFAGNATKKAVELAKWIAVSGTGVTPVRFENEDAFVLADDSGLEVDALNGAPGIYSARFAAMDSGENSSDGRNNEKLLRLLENVSAEKRTARFRCVIALTPIVLPGRESESSVCYADEAELRTEIFDGACEGEIAFTPSGQGGFGYDPLFVPNGFGKSFAELGEGEKNKISHRAKALEKLRSGFNG